MSESRLKVLDPSKVVRRMPVGAELQPGGGVHFRVWAPHCRRVSVQVADSANTSRPPFRLSRDDAGYWAGYEASAFPGDRYWFLVDDDESRLPDPASRFQPKGPHGPSEVVDPSSYRWGDSQWPGVALPGQVFYELHLGTFTAEGTWAAATCELSELAAVGITVIEILPVATFPGRFNWGYDGVGLFAPSQLYGRPDDMRRFVDAAHQLNMGVILDVVYNHVGPDGNYLRRFSFDYFTERHQTDWGEALNFDGPGSEPVREFFVQNAGYWIDEFHLDGLRLDATQNIYDQSPDHVVTALTRHAREKAGERSIIVVAENEPQQAQLVRSAARGGSALDGIWNDDFHHAALVALRGRAEAYYSDYRGTAHELLAAAKHGFLYQGQWSQWQEQRRGTPALDLPPWRFITFLENHDQVANSLHGERVRLLSHPGAYRALTALLLLGPGTPLLFQGQEFGATTPFLFFADHHAELAPLVHKGRSEFLKQFPSVAAEESRRQVDDPACEDTFRRCTLDFSQRQLHHQVYRLHKDLLRLRREEPALQPRDQPWFDGAVLSDQAFFLRYFGAEADQDRVLLVNVGTDHPMSPISSPLLAAPVGRRWAIRWSSESSDYGGSGTPGLDMDANWRLLGQAALWLAPEQLTGKEASHG